MTAPVHVSNGSSVHNDSSKGPLAGIRILDLTSVVLGPLATQVLGDYGAEVIKIEGHDGDLMRANGVSRNQGMSSIFLAINRNKRSLAVDLKKTEGRRIFLELAARADVVIHNMRMAAIKRLHLDYDTVREVNPNVIYCSATGFGQEGPDRSRPALDDIVQAACGLSGLLEDAHGKPEYVPTLVADKTAGMAIVNAVLAALFHRQRSGVGQHLEVPMFETMVEFTMAEHMGGRTFIPQFGPVGYQRIMHGGRRPLRVKDGSVTILPYNPPHWQALFNALGRTDILEKYKLSNRSELNAQIRALYNELEAIGITRTAQEWIDICDSLDIPATKIYHIDELHTHPQLQAVGMFQSMEHPSEGLINYVRPAVRFQQTPASVRMAAPLLGQHTVDILQEIGYSSGRIRKLYEKGVVKGTARRGDAASGV